jgi:hypothetical protein
VKPSSPGAAQIDALEAWARLNELELGRDRIIALAPAILERLAALSDLWSIDVDGVEMAINFCEDSSADAR